MLHWWSLCYKWWWRFGRSIYDIYPKELKLKIEHQGDHATLFNLDIIINKGTLMYKLFDKKSSFPVSILRMPHIENNIPQTIFYSAIKGEFLGIAHWTLCLRNFIPKAKESLEQEIFKLGTPDTSLKLVSSIFYPFFFSHQVIALQKLWKMFFISSEKLFPFSRYSNFCNFFPSFSHFPDLKGQMEVE